jgi:hypothetical protein
MVTLQVGWGITLELFIVSPRKPPVKIVCFMKITAWQNKEVQWNKNIFSYAK